jgi:hypothetical protein
MLAKNRDAVMHHLSAFVRSDLSNQCVKFFRRLLLMYFLARSELASHPRVVICRQRRLL